MTREDKMRRAAARLADAIDAVSEAAGYSVGDPYADAVARWDEDGWPATKALIHALHQQ